MRQITFRAWFPEDHWYHQGMLYGWENTTGIESLCFVPDEESGIKVMQFTGLQDKNGVDIYEGDIVRYSVYGDSIYAEGARRNVPVEWHEEGSWRLGDSLCNAGIYSDVERIGNIHQHAELLEVSG